MAGGDVRLPRVPTRGGPGSGLPRWMVGCILDAVAGVAPCRRPTTRHLVEKSSRDIASYAAEHGLDVAISSYRTIVEIAGAAHSSQ